MAIVTMVMPDNALVMPLPFCLCLEEIPASFYLHCSIGINLHGQQYCLDTLLTSSAFCSPYFGIWTPNSSFVVVIRLFLYFFPLQTQSSTTGLSHLQATEKTFEQWRRTKGTTASLTCQRWWTASCCWWQHVRVWIAERNLQWRQLSFSISDQQTALLIQPLQLCVVGFGVSNPVFSSYITSEGIQKVIQKVPDLAWFILHHGDAVDQLNRDSKSQSNWKPCEIWHDILTL